MAKRVAFALTIYRFDDGSTAIGQALDGQEMEIPMPAAWEHRHEMLVDALATVKRDGGVEP